MANLLLIVFELVICTISEATNLSPDYPNITICLLSENHAIFQNADFSYEYLKRIVGLDKRCTHIRGNLVIRGLDRMANGSDPDLSFLKSIEEISGDLIIQENTVRQIPLTNLKVIRGLKSIKSKHSLMITYNGQNGKPNLEEIDLRNLRVIMRKNIVLGFNPGLKYLHQRIDWTQIVADPLKQEIKILPNSNDEPNECHSQCTSWESSLNISEKFCFGPLIEDCQIRSKCSKNSNSTWCHFNDGCETPCNKNCVGGCSGESSENCAVCSQYLRGLKCTETCDVFPNLSDGSQDNLIYTVDGFCTSKCPASRLDQKKMCVFQCDFNKYFRYKNRCLEINGYCKPQHGIEIVCDLKVINARFYREGRINRLTAYMLEKLTNCTIIIGQLYIDDDSFSNNGVTIPMLYKHLGNVEEISGGLSVVLMKTLLRNITFLSNLREIRPLDSGDFVETLLVIEGNSLEFLGLKNLQKVHGSIIINGKENICYLNSIPWYKITNDSIVTSYCIKPCHPLCTNGCWGPGNDLCYNCASPNNMCGDAMR